VKFSEAYVQLLTRGPFPGRIDPWAEAGRYFQQIHSGIINHLLIQIQNPLIEMGYLVGKETSLQIAENREPDVYIRHSQPYSKERSEWDYTSAAAAVMAEPGLQAEMPELEALYIKSMDSGDLITIIEIVSPSNKTTQLVEGYRVRRNDLLDKGVNVVEVDATRSQTRLFRHELTTDSSYHIAIHLPMSLPRVIPIAFHEAFKRFAIPLTNQVFPAEAQAAYDEAYRNVAIAGHIRHEGHYTETDLPFPSLLTAQQRAEALAAVEQWMNELEHLK
jgi:hypothetical protein